MAQKNFYHMWSSISISRSFPVISFCGFNLWAVPSFPPSVVSCWAEFCVMLLPHQIGCCSPAEFVFGVQTAEKWWWCGAARSAAEQGLGWGVRGGVRALLRKAGILPAGRWSQCIPPKQLPIGSQWSRARHWMRGKIMVGLSIKHLPLRTRRDRQKENTICLTVGEELSFTHLGYKVSFTVPSSIDNLTAARGISLFMSTAVFYYLVLKLSCKSTDRQRRGLNITLFI